MSAAPAIVDLRSDFLTRPTPAMLAAMAAAARAPAHFGLREDPQQQRLEQRTAELLGTEDALLMPTCTMANEIALMLLTAPGDVVLAPADAHVVTSEAGAPAALARVQVRAVAGAAPCPPRAAWEAAAATPADALKPRASALLLENTHNRTGGAPVSVEQTAEVTDVARAHGLRAHLDGARVFNAAVALGVPVHALCAGFDTVALSLNKGLGAPLGAMLAGKADLIARALVHRQRLGGAIRPTGMVSAAALEALADPSHLARDHARARALADGLAAIAGLYVDPAAVVTNIVVVDTTPSGLAAEETCARLARHGVLALPFGVRRVRLVVYRDIGDDDVPRVLAAFAAALA